MGVEQKFERNNTNDSSEDSALLPDLAQVRSLLRERCDRDDLGTLGAVDRLDVSYLKLVEAGTKSSSESKAEVSRLLFEGVRDDGRTLYLSGQRFRPAKGERVASELIRDWGRKAGRVTTGGFRQAAFFEPALGLLFQVFPLDRRLPSLPIAADGRALAPVLEALLAVPGAQILKVTARPMRYKPQRKCMFHYQITWDNASAGPGVVYGKVARASTFSQTRAILRRVRASARHIDFSLPESLGVVPELGMEFFSEVPGSPLADLSIDERFGAHSARAARALHQFHALPVVLDAHWDRAAKLLRLGEDAFGLCHLFPGRAPQICELQRELSALLSAFESNAHSLIHRDFHGTNVLVDGGRIGLIDLEDCAMGDPAEDLGSMCAYLSRLAAERPSQAATLRHARGTFLNAYADAGPQPDDFIDRVRTHIALYCFFQAFQQLRHPHVGERYRNAEQLLGDCEDALRGLLSG